MRTPKAHGAFVSELTQRTGMLAVMPEYRLAPEEPFPAAVEDVMACYRELLSLGYAPEDIVVAGDSAGGNLTMVLLQQAKKRGPSRACRCHTAITGDGSERPFAFA